LLVEEAKLGILLASLLAAVVGLTWLYVGADKPAQSAGAETATR